MIGLLISFCGFAEEDINGFQTTDSSLRLDISVIRLINLINGNSTQPYIFKGTNHLLIVFCYLIIHSNATAQCHIATHEEELCFKVKICKKDILNTNVFYFLMNVDICNIIF